jgi:alanyl-tRNA synthetase
MTPEEIKMVEHRVNQKIRENLAKEELRSVPISEAKNAGAMMLFGEKYGDYVRMITFDKSYSRELCGGCHVEATGEIGYFKIVSETGIAAGVRRIEAITASAAEAYLESQLDELQSIKEVFKTGNNIVQQVESLNEENKALKKEIEKLMAAQAGDIKKDLVKGAKAINGKSLVTATLNNMDSKTAKTLAYNILAELENGVVCFGIVQDDKPQLLLAIDEKLVKTGLNAGTIIRELAKEINGGGGGQPFFATAGGSKSDGLSIALKKIESLI